MAREFWLVWNEGGHAPTFKHPSLAAAKSEAERLARIHPEYGFHVLEWVGTARKRDVVWLTHLSSQTVDEIPF